LGAYLANLRKSWFAWDGVVAEAVIYEPVSGTKFPYKMGK